VIYTQHHDATQMIDVQGASVVEAGGGFPRSRRLAAAVVHRRLAHRPRCPRPGKARITIRRSKKKPCRSSAGRDHLDPGSRPAAPAPRPLPEGRGTGGGERRRARRPRLRSVIQPPTTNAWRRPLRHRPSHPLPGGRGVVGIPACRAGTKSGRVQRRPWQDRSAAGEAGVISGIARVRCGRTQGRRRKTCRDCWCASSGRRLSFAFDLDVAVLVDSITAVEVS